MPTTIAKAYVQILPSTKGMSASISNAIDGRSIGSKAGLSIGGALKGALAAAGIGAVLTKTIKSAVSKGAELEQSIGGIEALFGKKASKEVIKNADKAFSTVGMSADEYMKSATMFSASLVRGLDGDTQKAAKYVDKALKDMGDNFNRFGTNISSVQDAYKGFSRGNFMMLDNLNLGFGGTKQGMADLINESGVLGDTIVTIGQKGNFEKVATFDKMIDAIHIMQKRLNVAGTTAKEQSTTVQGSLSAVKSSFDNFLGNMATGRDIKKPLKQMVKTGMTFLKGNLIPMIKRVVVAIPEVFGADIIQNAPKLVISGMRFFEKFLDGIGEGTAQIYSKIVEIITKIRDSFDKYEGRIKKIGTRIFNKMVQGLQDGLPKVADFALKIVKQIMKWLKDNAPEIIKSSASACKKVAKAIIVGIGDAISSGISDHPLESGILAMLGGLILAGPQIKLVAGQIIKRVGTRIAIMSGGSSALSMAGTAFGQALLVAAVGYVSLNAGDAIGKAIREKWGSESQKEDTFGLMHYIFGDAHATAKEWLDAFEMAFLDEDSTLYKVFHPSSWFKKEKKANSSESSSSTSTTTSATKTAKTARSTPESLSKPKIQNNVKVDVSVGNKRVKTTVKQESEKDKVKYDA